MRIRWDYRYSLGVPELDNQHIKLFDMINDLMAGIEGNFREEATRLAVADLLKYTREHFAAEERVMQDVGYPGYDEIKAEHVKFADKMNELAAKVETDYDAASEELMAYLFGWAKIHLLGLDPQIGAFIKEQKKKR